MAKKKTPAAPKNHMPVPSMTIADAKEVTGNGSLQTNALAAAMATGNLDLVHATRVAMGLAPAARPSSNEE